MAKLKIPLLSLNASGGLGKALSFARRRGLNLVLKKAAPVDRKSGDQLTWRSMYGLCADLWHLLSAAEKAVWEAQGTARHMTGYAWYMSQCLRPNPGIYLPLAGGKMSGDIDMDGNTVEELADPAAAQDAVTKAYHDNPLNVPVHTAAKHTDTLRRLFICVSDPWLTAGSYDSRGYAPVFLGAANLGQPYAYFGFRVPSDFIAFVDLRAVWQTPAAAGNMYWRMLASYHAAGENYQTHTDLGGNGVTANLGANLVNVQLPAVPLTMVNLALGDYIGVQFRRFGADALDTLNDVVRLNGILFTYTAKE